MCECIEKYWTCLNCTIKQKTRELSTITVIVKSNTNLTDILVKQKCNENLTQTTMCAVLLTKFQITPKISQKPLMVTNNSYRKIFETTIDACILLGTNSNHILLSRKFLQLVRPYTNMANGCPYVKV